MDEERTDQPEQEPVEEGKPVETPAPAPAPEVTDEEKPAEVTEEKPEENPDALAATTEALLAELKELKGSLESLRQLFEDKIAEDAYKNGLFDEMHRELTRYQNGAMEKVVDTVAMDVIQLIDSTKSHYRVYETKEPTEENYAKLLRILKGIGEDLEDILYRQNIESYNVEGHVVDVRRQKILQTVPTDDPEKDNLVAVRMADGYEKNGKVLRPERIKIYKYVAPVAPEEK